MTPSIGTEVSAASPTGQDVLFQIKKVCEADILIGIPTYNNANTIGPVVRAVQNGLARAFPDLKAVILTSDSNSTDGTPLVVRNSVVRKIPIFIERHGMESGMQPPIPYYPAPARAASLRSIFRTAEELDARACILLEGDVTSITPLWIEALAKPVLYGRTDFVSPVYARHKFDSTLTNTILYPLTRAVYGKRIRQPICGNFCISGRLAAFYHEKVLENESGSHYGIYYRLLTEAIANDFAITQVFLGPRSNEPARKPDVYSLLPQVMEAAFGLIESDHHVWKNLRGSEPVPVSGSRVPPEREAVKPNVDRMLALFRQGVRDLKDILIKIIGPADFGVLEYVAFRPEGTFNITSTLWAQIVYDYALAYHEKKISSRHLLKSLTPLYLGKVASHVLEVSDKGEGDTEEEIEKICLAFEDGKEHLVRNWKN